MFFFFFFFFCTNSFNELLDRIWCCGSISLKPVLIFPKNFLHFWFDAIEKQSIKNFSRYRRKSYASIVLDDSVVTFHGEREDATICFSLSVVFRRCKIEVIISLSSIFLVVFCCGRQFLCSWFLSVLCWLLLG